MDLYMLQMPMQGQPPQFQLASEMLQLMLLIRYVMLHPVLTSEQPCRAHIHSGMLKTPCTSFSLQMALTDATGQWSVMKVWTCER